MDPAQNDSSIPSVPTSDQAVASAGPATGGGPNGDNSTINGDKPIENLPSNQIVEEKESMEAASMQSANAARNVKASPITQSVARDSKGESYDQIRKLGNRDRLISMI